MLALMSTVCMIGVPKLMGWLSSRKAIAIVLRFKEGFAPSEERLRQAAFKRGYEIASGSIGISMQNGGMEWHCVAVAFNKTSGAPLADLARELGQFECVESFQLSHARN